MVKGLNIFLDCISGFEGSFILIGGAACDLWFVTPPDACLPLHSSQRLGRVVYQDQHG